MKETDSSTPTPEQLMQILDAGIQLQRARRKNTGRNRFVFLAVGICFILTGAAVALLVLSQMLSESPALIQGQTAAVQE